MTTPHDATTDTTNAPEVSPQGTIVATIGARGGIGASSLSIMLARAVGLRGARVALVDADPLSGFSLLLGDTPLTGLHWADLPSNETAFRAERLCDALPRWSGITVLTADIRGGIPHKHLLTPVATAMARTHDLVIIDTPRTLSPPPGALPLVLSTLDLRSATNARILAQRLAQNHPHRRLVIRDDGEDLDADAIVRTTGCPWLGDFSTDRSLSQRAARGDDITRGRGQARRDVRQLAAALLDEITAINERAQAQRRHHTPADT